MLIAMIRSNALLRDTATQVRRCLHVRCKLFSLDRRNEKKRYLVRWSRSTVIRIEFNESRRFSFIADPEYQLRASCLSFGNFLRHEFLCVRVYWQITRCFWFLRPSFFFFSFFLFLLFSRWDPGVIFELNCAIFVDDKPLCEEYRQARWISTLLCLCRIQLAIRSTLFIGEKSSHVLLHTCFCTRAILRWIPPIDCEYLLLHLLFCGNSD